MKHKAHFSFISQTCQKLLKRKKECETLHVRLYSPCLRRLEIMRLLTKQFCIHCKPLASTLCFESFFLSSWMNLTHTNKFSFGLSMTCFLDKSGTTCLCHGKLCYPSLCNQRALNSVLQPNCESLPLSAESFKTQSPSFLSRLLYLFKMQLIGWLNLSNILAWIATMLYIHLLMPKLCCHLTCAPET